MITVLKPYKNRIVFSIEYIVLPYVAVYIPLGIYSIRTHIGYI